MKVSTDCAIKSVHKRLPAGQSQRNQSQQETETARKSLEESQMTKMPHQIQFQLDTTKESNLNLKKKTGHPRFFRHERSKPK